MIIAVTGAQDLFRLAHAYNEAGETGLKRELDRASREMGAVIIDAVEQAQGTYIPVGFEAEFAASLQSKVEVRLLSSRRVTVVFWAEGRGLRRDIIKINSGVLRHPVFGRTRRLRRHWVHQATSMPNPWVPQPVRVGLVDEPFEGSEREAVSKLEDAMRRLANKIERTG